MRSPRRDGWPQEHGGNRWDLLEAGVPEVVDFSASINPLGPPPGLRERLGRVWAEIVHYPPRDAQGLVRAVSRRHGVPEEAVLVGNGSAEIIDLCLRALEPRRVITSPPDFGLYERMAPPGAGLVPVPRRERGGFAPDLEALARTAGPGDVLILSNPSNPAGGAEAPEDLEALARRCARVGATLVLDEAFADFCPEVSLVERAPGHRALIVLRSLTKFYAIPGLRVGFGVAPPELADRIRARQVPWSVNILAQEAGAYCLDLPPGWADEALGYVGRVRALLHDGLCRIPGLTPLPSRANYILVGLSPPAPGATDLYRRMCRQGVLIRHCGSFGLGERYIRVAVRTEPECRLLLAALDEAVRRGAEPGPCSPVAP